MDIAKSAQLTINGSLIMGKQQVSPSHKETRLLLEQKRKNDSNKEFTMYADSYIRVMKNGELSLDAGFINEGVRIMCASKVSNGEGCVITRDVIIRD